MNWVPVFRDAAKNYLQIAVKAAGSGLLGPAWPFLEPALTPITWLLKT